MKRLLFNHAIVMLLVLLFAELVTYRQHRRSKVYKITLMVAITRGHMTWLYNLWYHKVLVLPDANHPKYEMSSLNNDKTLWPCNPLLLCFRKTQIHTHTPSDADKIHTLHIHTHTHTHTIFQTHYTLQPHNQSLLGAAMVSNCCICVSRTRCSTVVSHGLTAIY